MSGGIPRCPVCAHVVESVRDEAGWWALPCGHALGRWNFEDLRAQLEAARPPWRFDVPEVPPHVTCFRAEGPEGGDTVWVRLDDPDRWAVWMPARKKAASHAIHIADLWRGAPLVECPDPRAAS